MGVDPVVSKGDDGCTTVKTRVRLIRKLAPIINGIDLSTCKVGDVIDLPQTVAAMLILEGWVEVVERYVEAPLH